MTWRSNLSFHADVSAALSNANGFGLVIVAVAVLANVSSGTQASVGGETAPAT